MDTRSECHDATGIDADTIVFQLFHNHCSSGMDKGHAIPVQALEYESFTAEETSAEAPRKGDTDCRTEGSAEERILLTEEIVLDF